jgi:hypothetical protein
MTFIITAALSAAAVYFAIALIACLHDCLVTRYRRQFAPALDLPNSIRGLRDFVRAKSLQDAIKGITGKSVSNLNKDQLLEAVQLAIA